MRITKFRYNLPLPSKLRIQMIKNSSKIRKSFRFWKNMDSASKMIQIMPFWCLWLVCPELTDHMWTSWCFWKALPIQAKLWSSLQNSSRKEILSRPHLSSRINSKHWESQLILKTIGWAELDSYCALVAKITRRNSLSLSIKTVPPQRLNQWSNMICSHLCLEN